MCNSQNSKAATDKSGQMADLIKERPFVIDYWQDLSMSTDETATLVGAFMKESDFNDLNLAKAIKNGTLEEIQQLQDRMRTWFLCGIETELDPGVPSHFEDTIYALNDLRALIEMAIVGNAHGTKSFYYLTMASFQSHSSDQAVFIKDFYRKGFDQFCIQYAQQLHVLGEKTNLCALDVADIRCHTSAYLMVDEFISHVLTAIQQYEVNSLSEASTPA